MNIWEGIQNAIRHIEYSLTEELDMPISQQRRISLSLSADILRAVRLYGGGVYPQPQVQYGRLLQ